MKSYFYDIDDRILDASELALKKCENQLKIIDEIEEHNQQKILKAFQTAGVSKSHFAGSTGYGYGDTGRDKLNAVYANAFGAEDALVTIGIQSGTHALTVALFGMLRPGDTMLSVTGTPYDTMQSVIGISGDYPGTLVDFGIKYKKIDFLPSGEIDFLKIKEALVEKPKLVYIQRSRGYSLRRALLCEDIKKIANTVKEISPETIVMVDNCYGEFVEKTDAMDAGADIIAGSLIKNAGGGIAPTGGYIAGRADLVEMCSYRLTTPGTGKDLGASLSSMREMFLGAFNAPHITGEAMKTAVFASALFEILGFDVSPKHDEKRGDIVEIIKLGTPEKLKKFCLGIQHACAVDSFVTPVADELPGYDSKVIMAEGGFTIGTSIELSADAPLREPFAVWMQGGFNFHTGKIGVMLAADEIFKNE